jgi:uncharacterized membrane protein required for colicin V production
MLVVLLVSVITAVIKGLLNEIFSFSGTLLGLFLAIFLCSGLGKLLIELGVHSLLSGFLSFVLVFVFCLILGILFGTFSMRFLRFTLDPGKERLLSGLLGFLRGLVINTAVVMAFTAFPVSGTLISDSFFSRAFIASAATIVPIAPADFRESFNQGRRSLENQEGF